MASHSNLLCRLCLETSDDLVNIFDNFHNSTIASVLTQHFWFQIYKNDSFSEWICQTCWINTETFHRFYKRIEIRQTGYWNSIKLHEKEDGIPDKAACVDTSYSSDLIKKERSCSPQEVSLEPVLNVLKFEDTEPEQGMVDFILIKEESSNDNDYTSCDQSDFLIEYQCSDPVIDSVSFNENRKKNNVTDNNVVKTDKMRQHGKLSRTEKVKVKEKIGFSKTRKENADNNRAMKDKVKAQVREFFDMKCDTCSDVTFETLAQAKKHYRIVHKTSGHIACCNRKFFKHFMVIDHINYHLNPDAFRCTTCNKRCRDRNALKVHIDSHELRATYNCSSCSKSYKSAVTLLEHERTKHSAEKDKTFQCDICKKCFFTKTTVALHLRRVHALAYSQDHVCEICARVFKSKWNLRYHMQDSHSTTIQPKVQCNICGAWSKSEYVLRKHLKTHREDYAKCPICNKVLQHAASLRSHISLVHGERRHQCVVCNKALSSATTLKEHMAVHTGVDLYKCPYCEKTFKSKANMHSHRKKSHFTEWNREFRLQRRLEKISTK